VASRAAVGRHLVVRVAVAAVAADAMNAMGVTGDRRFDLTVRVTLAACRAPIGVLHAAFMRAGRFSDVNGSLDPPPQ